METNTKTMLAAGGILAVALTIGSQIDGTKTPVPEPVSVQIAKAERGAEIKALRTANSETFKADSVWVHPKDARGKSVKADSFKVAAFTARVYARPKYFRDADGDTLRPLDLTVRDISALAKLNPLKTHDKYVDAGPYNARWMADKPGDFRMDSGGAYVKYRALFGGTGITVATEPTADGMKETVTLADSAAGEGDPAGRPYGGVNVHALRWVVETDGTLAANAAGGFDVRAKDGTVPMLIQRPVAWDADNKPVMASATVEGDTLTFRVTVLPGQKYPVTVDPTTSVAVAANDAAVYSDTNANYETARNADPWAYVKSAAGDSAAIIGQYYGGGSYNIYGRYLTGFYINNPNIATVDACTLYVYCHSDNSTTDFTIDVIQSHQNGVPTTAWQKEIYGWGASGSYSANMAAYEYGAKNTIWLPSAPLWIGVPFISRLDSVCAAIARNDTIKMCIMSYNDITNTPPTGSEEIRIKTSRAATSVRPYLSITYTSIIPTGFSATGASTTTANLAWTNNISGETGYRIYDLDATAYVDTVAADTTHVTITGLSVNTKYRYLVEVIGGSAAGAQSLPDSCYTLAATPGAMTVTFPTDALALLKLNVNGNPSYTEFAIQDSITGLYVDGRFNRFFTTTAPESILWRTYAAWGGSNGDTVAVGVGKKTNLRAKARSGQ